MTDKTDATEKGIKTIKIIDKIKTSLKGFGRREELEIPPQWRGEKPKTTPKTKKKLLPTILDSLRSRISISDSYYLTRAQKVKKLLAFLLLIGYLSGTYYMVIQNYYEGLIINIPTIIIILDYLGTGLRSRTKWKKNLEDKE